MFLFFRIQEAGKFPEAESDDEARGISFKKEAVEERAKEIYRRVLKEEKARAGKREKP